MHLEHQGMKHQQQSCHSSLSNLYTAYKPQVIKMVMLGSTVNTNQLNSAAKVSEKGKHCFAHAFKLAIACFWLAEVVAFKRWSEDWRYSCLHAKAQLEIQHMCHVPKSHLTKTTPTQHFMHA